MTAIPFTFTAPAEPQHFALYASHGDTRPAKFLSFEELTYLAMAPTIGPKAKAALLTPFVADGKKQEHASAAHYWAIVIDHDNDNLSLEQLERYYSQYGLKMLAFTTSSHQQQDDRHPVKQNRWKVVIPLADAGSADQVVPLSQGLTYALKGDPAQARKQQGFYAPNVLTADAPYDWFKMEGEPLDINDTNHPLIIAALEGLQEMQDAEEAKAKAAAVKPRPDALASQHGDIIGKIRHSDSMANVLTRNGYKRRGRAYLSPFSQSGAAGVYILKGKDGEERVYSHHGEADPLSNLNHNGHSLDLLDVLTALEHGGDMRRAIADQANTVDPEGQKQRQREYMAAQEAAAIDSGAFECIPDLTPAETTSEPQGAIPATLKAVELVDVMSAQPEPVRFAVDPLMPKRHVTLLGGHGGIGKSSLALGIAAHVACGRDFAGLPVTQSPVVFVSLEDESAIVRLRLRKVIEAYQLPPQAVLENMRLLDGTEAAAALMVEGSGHGAAPTFTRTYNEVSEASEGAGLIIIDNASDAFAANENARREVRLFIRGLAAIARHHDAALVLLAHIDKNAAKDGARGNSYSGSTAWHNSARSRLALMEQDGHIQLLHEKANLSKKAPPLEIAFRDDVPMPEVAAAADGLTQNDFDQVTMLQTLELAFKSEITVPASLTPGAHCAMAALENMAEYPHRFTGKAGRRKAAQAITSLIRAGRVMVVKYRNEQRKTKVRLALPGTTGAEETP